MSGTEKKTADFEQAIQELEKLVEKLESGDCTLEESLQLYERGVELQRNCQKQLDQAEQKIQILQNGKLQDFTSAEGEEPPSSR